MVEFTPMETKSNLLEQIVAIEFQLLISNAQYDDIGQQIRDEDCKTPESLAMLEVLILNAKKAKEEIKTLEAQIEKLKAKQLNTTTVKV